MTAKDKAQELIGRFLTGIEFDVQSQSCMDWTSAKKCALFCVDEILNEKMEYPSDPYYMRAKYFEEVRTEIEKL